MFKNKYAFTSDDPTLVRKPFKKIVPKGPDLANFATHNANFKKLANFGLEMMKFLPQYEQMIYEGKKSAQAGDEGTVSFEHGLDPATGKPYVTYVTKEYWEAFNEYDAKTINPGLLLNLDGDDKTPGTGLVDLTGDGRVTNIDSLKAWEAKNPGQDGYTTWRSGWVSGMHHRAGSFGNFTEDPETGMAGAGTGGAFRNIDFEVSADEWNHIKYTKSEKYDPTAIEDKAYYANDLLAASGKSWEDVKNLINNKFPGQSYYQIVMNGSYASLSSDEAFLLTAAMYESRERAWAMMTEVVGPVTETRDDAKMMAHIDAFMKTTNPYLDGHSMALFPFFFYIQHSFTNQLTMFYEKGDNNGYNMSDLDRSQFWKFSQWLGRNTFNHTGIKREGDGYKCADDFDYQGGVLYDLWVSLDQQSSAANDKNATIIARRDAVGNLINKWFGATEAADKPRWEEYLDTANGGNWVGVNSGAVWAWDSGAGWSWKTPTSVYKPNIAAASYSWDRKWTGVEARERIKIKFGNNQDAVTDYMGGNPGWIKLFNIAYGDTNRLNDAYTGQSHANYAGAQFENLSFNETLMGQAFNSNWVVHAVGTFYKKGVGQDLISVMQRCAAKRVAVAEFKQDMNDYIVKLQELAEKQVQEAKAANLAKQRRKALEKQSMNKPAAKSSSQQNSASKSKEKEYKIGSKEYQQRLVKYSQRLLQGNAKRKQLLKNMREG